MRVHGGVDTHECKHGDTHRKAQREQTKTGEKKAKEAREHGDESAHGDGVMGEKAVCAWDTQGHSQIHT